jgi:hypothetical protein
MKHRVINMMKRKGLGQSGPAEVNSSEHLLGMTAKTQETINESSRWSTRNSSLLTPLPPRLVTAVGTCWVEWF